MNTQDILNAFLIIGILLLLVYLTLITYFLIQALKAITRVADNLKETAKDINSLKGSLQMKFLSTLPLFLAGLVGKFLKRGR